MAVGLLLAAVVAGEAARQSLLASLGPVPLVYDAGQYWRLGELAARGDWLLFSADVAHRTPGYPWLIGAFLRWFGPWALTGVVGLQHVLVLATSAVTAAIAWRWTGRAGAGVAAYLMAALCVSRPWYAGTVLTETLFTFVFTLFLAAGLWHLRRGGLAAAGAAGAAAGACAMIRPTAQLLWTAWLAAALWPGGPARPWRRRWAEIMVMLGLVAAPLTLWAARNERLYGSPFVVRVTGRSLWIVAFQRGACAGLPLPEDDPAFRRAARVARRAAPDVDFRYGWSVARALRSAGLNDAEVDRLMGRAAWAAVVRHPGRFAWAAAKRAGDFWRCVENAYPPYGQGPAPGGWRGQHVWRWAALAGAAERLMRRPAARSLLANSLVSLLVWVALAVLAGRPETRREALLMGLAFAWFAAVTGLFEIPNYRYRMVLEPWFIVALAGAGARVAARRGGGAG